MNAPERPLQPGDSAPDFALPVANREGFVSLSDYRGRCSVLVGFFRGLFCPFCRRQIARLAMVHDELTREGVEMIGVIGTPVPRARQYLEYRPTPVTLVSDPEVASHRAYGLHRVEVLPDTVEPAKVQWPRTTTMTILGSTSTNAGGELSHNMTVMAASEALNRRDGYDMSEADMQDAMNYGLQSEGQFLIDEKGIIRWAFIESPDNPNQAGRAPSPDELLGVARAMAR